ncbi:MAG: PilZ domain-containing protein [Acidobacteriota bacterium]|nr:PilZ domain-containing protein [Acidobacteriota bacterium]
MAFQALLVSNDEKAAEVLIPALHGFGVAVQICGYSEGPKRVTQEKFDAIIVDFDDRQSAVRVLENASASTGGKTAVTIALLSDKTKARTVFGAGANFVLYKPISAEQAQTGLRAATTLIKRERRGSLRVAVQVPVRLEIQNGLEMEAVLLDLSQDGMDILSVQPLCPSAAVLAHFMLKETDTEVEIRGVVAWANPNGESGVRFVDVPAALRATLKEWVVNRAQGSTGDGTQAPSHSHCNLTDLSSGGCYVETESPFPERTPLTLCLKAAGMEVQAEGIVRVMHSGFGMGIEFALTTDQQCEQVENFIHTLIGLPSSQPELLIAPHNGEESGPGQSHSILQHSSGEKSDDALRELLRNSSLGREEFLRQLRKQRAARVLV